MPLRQPQHILGMSFTKFHVVKGAVWDPTAVWPRHVRSDGIFLNLTQSQVCVWRLLCCCVLTETTWTDYWMRQRAQRPAGRPHLLPPPPAAVPATQREKTAAVRTVSWWTQVLTVSCHAWFELLLAFLYDIKCPENRVWNASLVVDRHTHEHNPLHGYSWQGWNYMYVKISNLKFLFYRHYKPQFKPPSGQHPLAPS